ncbi:carbonic anhydrase 4-like isoform X2 [Periophthalmus magnuspinnatus]|uniref:carbonic anhydrase 4-like isoform X2 n=1 Tax=Periophthalmus magnuspinnatus TaxID=409849 RepID=UPI0024368D36|nr:carbonic anhydrase 4-like isoform X2 [Periophthalmus magnuspinnatus]
MYILLTVLCLSWGLTHGAQWCYTGCEYTPSHWANIEGSFCGGKRQSPVNIVTSNVKKDEHLGNFTFVNFTSREVFESMVNTGDTVKINLKKNMVEFHGGGLNGTYTAIQFHFHWGDTEYHPGSEHLINGKRSQMEMHVVSLKKGYTTEEALADSQGIAVLGFLIEANKNMSKSEPWMNLTSLLTNSKDLVNLTEAISINDLIGTVNLTKFYRYMGSLTTPMCNEAVLWTVFEEAIQVHPELLQLFPTKTDITNVYRPTQDLNGRWVYASPAVQLPPAYEWCYDKLECEYDPEHWYTLPGSSCSGTRQSPLDISSKDAVVNTLLDEFHFQNFDHKNAINYAINTGHTVKYMLKEDMVEVWGGGLGHVYSVLQFHFHWASDAADSLGSEHLYNSKRFPMEMHIVTKRKDLTLDEAVMTGNGLAVLGFFMEEETSQSSNTEAWKLLTGYLSDIQKTGTMAKFSAEVSIDDLLGDVDRGMYYRYNGSLTTPSCNEAVVWTVFKYPIKVEKSLMQMFPTKMEYHNVYRPVQDFHSRTIYTSAAAASNLPTFLVLLLLSSSHVLSE